jgi:aldehyde dehydrogenase (NAD+)
MSTLPKAKAADLNSKREYFQSGITRSYQFRLEMLTKLETAIKNHEVELLAALFNDLKKPELETYTSEILTTLAEIKTAKKNLKKWMRVKKVKTPFLIQPGKSFIRQEPYGVVLIIGPWNYPINLTLNPLIAAIAAGNAVTIKPSEISANSAKVLEKIIQSAFDPEYIDLIQGGVPETQSLLEQDFDYIFFTGSTPVGKIVMEKAAKKLTPLTLELGGKNPTIVNDDANLELAAKRICWGKFLNAGQTCIAPDYALVQESVSDQFLSVLKKIIKDFYGDTIQLSTDYSRIINLKNHRRLQALIDPEKLIFGGSTDEEDLYIEPSILAPVSWDDTIMEDEIFGPLLPIIPFKNLEDHYRDIEKRGKPLALYIFSESKEFCDSVAANIPSGGVNYNDSFAQMLNPHLPFGGIGTSGMGNYHGESGFKTLSHERAYVKRSTKIDPSMKYPPSKIPFNKIKKFLDFFMG